MLSPGTQFTLRTIAAIAAAVAGTSLPVFLYSILNDKPWDHALPFVSFLLLFQAALVAEVGFTQGYSNKHQPQPIAPPHPIRRGLIAGFTWAILNLLLILISTTAAITKPLDTFLHDMNAPLWVPFAVACILFVLMPPFLGFLFAKLVSAPRPKSPPSTPPLDSKDA